MAYVFRNCFQPSNRGGNHSNSIHLGSIGDPHKTYTFSHPQYFYFIFKDKGDSLNIIHIYLIIMIGGSSSSRLVILVVLRAHYNRITCTRLRCPRLSTWHARLWYFLVG